MHALKKLLTKQHMSVITITCLLLIFSYLAVASPQVMMLTLNQKQALSETLSETTPLAQKAAYTSTLRYPTQTGQIQLHCKISQAPLMLFCHQPSLTNSYENNPSSLLVDYLASRQ